MTQINDTEIVEIEEVMKKENIIYIVYPDKNIFNMRNIIKRVNNAFVLLI